MLLLLVALVAPARAADPTPTTSPARALEATNPIPVLAYYYIWFDEASWDRAKKDYPTLGRYSSDDPEVMRQHVRWAKDAGIDGFIVSWKSTPTLDRRLEQLIAIAEEEDFKLGIIYQGLDFERNPLPPARIESDLIYFLDHYAASPAFQLFEKPLVILSGTWEYSPFEIESITANTREPLLVLASEKNLKGYERLAHLVDGNAYYWSSVNPDTFPRYQEKLDEMSRRVHDDGGLWIAPAAPGFDATMLGGESTVERQDGKTLRRQYDAAMRSDPDAVGVISWNEFSENSHIEPSQAYGDTYLKVLSDIHQLPPPAVDLSGSTDDEGVVPVAPTLPGDAGALGRTVALALLIAMLVAGPIYLARRQRRGTPRIRSRSD